MSPIRLVVVDDSDLIRGMIRTAVSANPEVEIVGEAADGRAGLDVCLQVRPDAVLLDVEMPGLGGIAILPDLRVHLPQLVIGMYSATDDRAEAALSAGAHMFFLKGDVGPFELLDRLVARSHEMSMSSRTSAP